MGEPRAGVGWLLGNGLLLAMPAGTAVVSDASGAAAAAAALVHGKAECGSDAFVKLAIQVCCCGCLHAAGSR